MARQPTPSAFDGRGSLKGHTVLIREQAPHWAVKVQLLALATVVVVAGAAAGCSAKAASPAAVTAQQGAEPGGAPGAPGEVGGSGEAPTVSFTHPTLKYTVSAPGPMVVEANGDAAYTGPTDYLHVSLVAGGGAPLTLAKADAGGGGVPGFVLSRPPQAVTIGAQQGASLEFTRDGGTNPVNGKAQTAHVVRVYLPGKGGAYRLEYGATVSPQNWDPQGALDLLVTFRPGP